MNSREDIEIGALKDSINHLKITDLASSSNGDNSSIVKEDHGCGVQITCFSEVSQDDVNLHFQIIRLQKQSNTVAVTCLLGGSSDNTGSGIARRLVLKTGLNIVVASNIPKNSPMLEGEAEKKLMQKLISLGYTKPRSQAPSA
ncbi:PREDICTED: uncharacterized protein LOC109156794 isoform X2 [Ipomoea nil]|uniref:uncharacterized protein LOC109156794 isoform X2 n=1 Tax=Ipomoea nil TaxID=35883 RepID=UPI0009013CE5|nr:PREDICTED: uncharacterized protein LOC109156794 isoform X2 [Ipomoea nil]